MMFPLWTTDGGRIDFYVLAFVCALGLIFGARHIRIGAAAIVVTFFVQRALLHYVPDTLGWLVICLVEAAFILVVMRWLPRYPAHALAALAFVRMCVIAAMTGGALSSNSSILIATVALYCQLAIIGYGGSSGVGRHIRALVHLRTDAVGRMVSLVSRRKTG